MPSEWSKQKSREKKLAKRILRGSLKRDDVSNRERWRKEITRLVQTIVVAQQRLEQLKAVCPDIFREMFPQRPPPVGLIKEPTLEETAAVSQGAPP